MLHDQGNARPTRPGHGGDLMAEIASELEEQAGSRCDFRFAVKGHERGIEEQSSSLQIFGDIQVEDGDFDGKGRKFRPGPGVETSVYMGGHMSTFGDAERIYKKGVGAVRRGFFQKVVKQRETLLEARETTSSEGNRKTLCAGEPNIERGPRQKRAFLHELSRLLNEGRIEI